MEQLKKIKVDIDFKKAFDYIWRRKLWKVLRHRGYLLKVVRILESLFLQSVRTSGGLSDWFQTVVGVLQSCILSPLLFNLFLEVVMAKALECVDVGITICVYTLYSLRFADDIAAASDSQQGLQSVVGCIANASDRMGMCISTEKT